MATEFVPIGIGALAVLGLCAAVLYRWHVAAQSELERELDRRLAEELPVGTASHLETSPSVRRLDVRESDSDGDGSGATYVPAVRIDLGTTDAPGMKLAFEFVAAVIEAIQPVFDERDARVARYDVEFTFGPGGLLVGGECRCVSVSPTLADRLLEDETYRAFDLKRDVERADGDDSVSALWEPCESGR
ncbi:hypothetical protein ACLI4Z_00425 [Natrialbaceae archaeon A-arb3/5]